MMKREMKTITIIRNCFEWE